MSRVALRGWLLGMATAAWLLGGVSACADEPEIAVAPPLPPAGVSSSEARILAELDNDTSLEFIETPLVDVIDYLKDLHGIEIQLDRKALDGAGIGSDKPITRELKRVSLRSALRLMLREIDLTFTIRDEVLLITTAEHVKADTDVRVYDVSSLLTPGTAADELAKALAVVMQSKQTAPPSSGSSSTDSADRVLEEAKKEAASKADRTIAPYGQMLIVRDTPLGHHELLKTLKAIRTTQLLKAEAEPAGAAK